MSELPKNASESFKRRNPHLYGNQVGKVEASQSKPAPVQTLVSGKQKQQGGPRRLGIVISMCVHRRRIVDDDNNVGSCKPLRDAIAKSIGLDDGDKRIAWQYTQLPTRGSEGIQVTIENLNPPPR